jgi:hypothetical protein
MNRAAERLFFIGGFLFKPLSLEEQSESESVSSEQAGIEQATTPTVQSGLNTMFKAMGELDKMFFAAKEPIEIAVWPIAIYREVRLPDTNLDQTEEA